MAAPDPDIDPQDADAERIDAESAAGPPMARQIVALSSIAIFVGLLAGAGASAFVAVEHHLQNLVWQTLPESMGLDQAPAWLVVGLLVVGALITYVGLQLPGKGGHAPLSGFALDIGPGTIISALVAALGSLIFGAVLGPEAPLMAVGTAVGALAFRDKDKPIRLVMMLVGAMAAIGAIFGNPLVTCVLLLEMATIAGPPLTAPPVLMSALAGTASGYVLQVGLGDWSGLGEAQLGLKNLAPYTEVHVEDLVTSLVVAILVALVALAARLAGLRVATVARRQPLLTIVAVGVVVALSAIAVDAITGSGIAVVLFSGQSTMQEYLALTSLGTAVVILLGKFVAYAACLGGGFRGGPIFPAVALGVIISTSATTVVSGTSTSALAAAGIAAAVAAAMRLPFVALVMGVTMTYPAGGATTVLAALGTIIGLSVRMAGERFAPSLRPAPAPSAPAGAAAH
jgi:H+/Cl- antiporter ClcA